MTKRERIMTGMGVSGGTSAPGSRRSQIKQALGGNQPKGQGNPSVSPGFQPRLGRQLSGRVQSGAINQTQAQRTAKQRQLLQKAFGSDWRTQVFGKGGAKGIGGPFAQAQVRTKRSQALGRAKKKLY